MTNCPKCKKELPVNAKKCSRCGAKIVTKKHSEKITNSLKPLGFTKLKSIFKPEPTDDEVSETDVIRPEVETLPTVSEAVAMQLPVIQECGVCQGEIAAGEIFIRCYCELITHVECVSDRQSCPQCGKELDLELMLPEDYKMKKASKKPTILEAKERKIKELIPPATSYFAHIPRTTQESKTKSFLDTYYTKHKMGNSTRTKDVLDIDMFISVNAAKKMLDHCYECGREKEVMGLILGETYKNNKKLFSIAKDVATSDLDASKVNVKFKSFRKLFEHLDQVSYDYQIIGWYHSHPGHTCFMSTTDVDTQQRMFRHPYQCAIVIDPINYDMKAFTLDQKTKSKVKESKYAIIDFKD